MKRDIFDKWIELEKDISIEKTEVLVIGGGTAGVIAAVASARRKTKTVVVEKNSYLGGSLSDLRGMPIEGAVPGYVSLGGLMDEILAKLRFAGPDGAEVVDDKYCGVVYYHEPEYVKFLADDLMEKSHCRVMLNTCAVELIEDGSRVIGAVVSTNMKKKVILAEAVVDCTGEAWAVRSMGIPMQKEEEDKIYHYPYILENVDTEKVFQYMGADPGLEQAVKKAITCNLNIDCSDQLVNLRDYKENMILADTIRLSENTKNAEAAAHKKIWVHLEFFRRFIPGMEQCRVFRCSEKIFSKSGPRIVGKKVYGIDETQKNVDLADGIVRICLGRENWQELPYDMMVPQGAENVLVAGKTVSVDENVQKVMGLGTVMVIGHAAGVAASIIAQSELTNEQIDGRVIKSLLEELGCDISGDKSRKFLGDKQTNA